MAGCREVNKDDFRRRLSNSTKGFGCILSHSYEIALVFEASLIGVTGCD